MVRRMLGIGLAGGLAAFLFHASRYSPFEFWRGDLLRSWLAGTVLFPFDVLVWGTSAFLLLTAVQTLVDRLKR